MSVISTWVATPNRVRMIYDFLDGSSGEERSRIEQLAGPLALSKQAEDPEEQAGTTTVPSTITEGLSIGLFFEEDGRLRARPLDRDLKAALGRDDAYAQMIETLLLNPSSPGADGQRNFGAALAWLLCQSPREPLPFSGSQVNLLRGQLNGDDFFQLNSLANWQAFCYWARALGYCTFIRIDDRLSVYPDPTRAVARFLKRGLPKRDSLKVTDLPSLLAESTVLDGGTQRAGVLARFKESQHLPSRLSQSLSIALVRLESAHKIRLTQLADGETRALDLGDRTRAITHVSREGTF